MLLAIDTETTGVPLWSYPDPYCRHQVGSWPRLVSVSWQVVTRNQARSPEEWVAKPDGFKIPSSASDIHGITHEKAASVGHPLCKILDILYALIESHRPGTVVLAAYNYMFDYGVIAAECTRLDHPLGPILKNKVEWQCIVGVLLSNPI
tara:strand:+ start:1114 stop:1560 length:447 start_codon:yes stop_codon:yes gene_type:complete